jgi:hypothetical protein
MEAREPYQPAIAATWRAKLVPLQGPATDTDIEVTHMASRLLTARCGRPMAPGLPVRVDQHDSIFLGEVVSCREETPGEFSLLIEMDESLCGLHSLRKLVSALLGEAQVGEPDHPLERIPRFGPNQGQLRRAG